MKAMETIDRKNGEFDTLLNYAVFDGIFIQ